MIYNYYFLDKNKPNKFHEIGANIKLLNRKENFKNCIM